MSNWPAADFLEGVSDHQREQYEIATQGNVGFLSGGPGTGKTRTSVSLIRAIEKQQGILAELIDDSLSHEERMNAIFDLRRSSSSAMIAVCAPTGKAATRSTEVMREAGLSLTATTIHRLLEVQGNGYETGVDLMALIETGRWISGELGRETGSKVGRAGPRPVADA